MTEWVPPLPHALQAELRHQRLAMGLDVCYYEATAHPGRPLVLLHSINAAPSAMEMKPLFEAYRHSRPVYALDLPGFGQSERGPLNYTPAFYAQAITEFLRALPGPAPDIVALSLSAEFVARAVVESGAPCHRLVLLSPTGVSQRQPPDPESIAPVTAVVSAPWISDVIYRGLTSRPSIRFFLNKAFYQDPPSELVDYAWQTARADGAKFAPLAFLGMRLFTRDAMALFYSRLTCPTLILYDSDPNIDFEALPDLLADNKQVTAERIAPTLGLPQWELPDTCVDHLNRFLQTDPAAS